MTTGQQPLPPIRLISNQPISAQAIDSLERADLRSERIKEFLQASNLAANTQKSYRLELERFVFWSDKAWIDITSRDIARFKKYLKDECRTRQGKLLSPAAVNQAITALKSFFKWLQLAGYLDATAILPTAAVKFEKLGEPLPRHLSPDQMEAIYQAVTGDEDINLRDRALLAVLTHGLRAEDVSTLNVGNFDGTRLRFVRKKDKSEAIVPLRSSAREQIYAYLERRRSQREELSDESPLFLSYDPKNSGQSAVFSRLRQGILTNFGTPIPPNFGSAFSSTSAGVNP